MLTRIEAYNLKRFRGKKNKKIISEILELSYVENCIIDKENKEWILKINFSFENEEFFDNKLPKYNKAILTIIQKYEPKALFEIALEEEVFRKVVYLKGLDCAHCAARIESIAKRQFKHQQIIVDFATTRFIIETTDKELAEDIVEEVSNVAHRVDPRIVVQDGSAAKKTYEEDVKEKKDIVFWVLSSIGLVLLLISVILEFEIVANQFHHSEMEVGQWFFEVYSPLGTALFSISFLLLSYKVLWQFFKNLFTGHLLDENFLMTIASIGSIINAHFLEAISVMVLFQVGEMIQERVVNSSRKSISNLLKLDVKKAKIKVKGELVEVDVESILPGDIISINKGEMIPLDGKLLSDHANLDTKNITGESLHRIIKCDEDVYAGSINMSNTIEVVATKVYSDSMITKILDAVQNATSIKSKSEKFITKFSKVYTPIVVFFAVAVALIGFVVNKWGMFGLTPNTIEGLKWIYRGSIFLVISCPCALVISIPLCYFKGLGLASSRGILVKGSNYLEALSKVKKIVFDKTGTITTGDFDISEVIPVKEGITEKDLLKYIAYVEYYASHPVGIALVDLYGRQNVFTEIISEFEDIQSRGCSAVINGQRYYVGSIKLMEDNEIDIEPIQANGLVIYISRGKEFLGYVVVGDKIRENADSVIKSLRKQGVNEISMFTGDSKHIGDYVGSVVGADIIYSNLLPDQKVEKLQEVKAKSNKNESIAFVGDGLNDAPVIASADIGIAMGSGASDATIAISDIVIMNENLAKVDEIVYIAKKTKQKVIQNIVFCLTIKIGIMILNFIPSIPVPVWVAIFGDVGVSLIAIANSMLAMKRFKKVAMKEENAEDEKE